MNSNRMLVFILLALVVVFVGVGGWLYSNNNSEITKQNNLKNQIVLDKKTLTQDEAANAAQQKQSVICKMKSPLLKQRSSKLIFQLPLKLLMMTGRYTLLPQIQVYKSLV